MGEARRRGTWEERVFEGRCRRAVEEATQNAVLVAMFWTAEDRRESLRVVEGARVVVRAGRVVVTPPVLASEILWESS